jgi:hypothetical protein
MGGERTFDPGASHEGKGRSADFVRSALISAEKRCRFARVWFAAGALHMIVDHSSQTPEHGKRRHERALFELNRVSNADPLRRTDA